MRWKNVKTAARVVDPAGQVFHVLPRVLPTMVQLRNNQHRCITLAIDPEAYVPTLFDPEAVAIDNLSTCFTLEFLGER